MAAITEKRNKKTQKMTLRSSEFPDLKVEGYFQYEKDLRKKLNAMMRKRRAKSGGPTGKSPTEKEVKPVEKKDMSETEKLGAKQKQYPASTMPSPIKKEKVKEKKKEKKYTAAQLAKNPSLRKKVAKKVDKKVVAEPEKKADTYQGHKSDVAWLKKQGKKKKHKDVEKMTPTKIGALGDEAPGYTSAVPEEPDTSGTRGLSSLPHIRERQLAEIKRKKESDASQLAPKTGPVLSKRSHPSKILEDRKLAGEKAKVEQEGRVHAGEFGDAQREQIQKPPHMRQSEWDKIPISQRRKVVANLKRRDAKAEHLTDGMPSLIPEPRDQSPPENVPTSREEQIKKIKMMLTRGEIDPNSPEVKRILGNENLPEHLRTEPKTAKEKYREKIKMMLTRGEIDPNSAEVKRILGEDYLEKLHKKEKTSIPDAGAELEAMDSDLEAQESQALQQSDAQAKENAGGLMKMPDDPSKTKTKTKTGEVSEEPVKYDENGYPIYAKGSKKAAEWNAAYAAAKVGKFMWEGRPYVKHGKPEEDEKAAVTEDKQDAVTGPIRQDYATGDANIMEELGAPEHPDSEAQESQAFQQSDAQAQENEDIAQKITNLYDQKDDHEGNLPEVQKLTRPLSKEDTAQVKEEAGDWYVDPWTGFAIDLKKLQKRVDRKDAMEFAALLPADQRAAYLSQEGLIEPEDLEKLLEPSELEQLQLQQAEIAVKTAAYNLVTAEMKRKDYRTPEQIEAADLKKTIAEEKRAEQTQIRKEGRVPTSNKAEMDRYAGLFKNAIKHNDFAGQVYWGELMGFPPKKMKELANKRMAWELKQEKKESGSAFKEIFEFEYSKVLTDRKGLLMGTASLWTTGDIDLQMGDRQIKSREGLLNTLGIEDYNDMTAEGMSDEEAIRMISSQSDLAIFRNPDYQDADGNPDWLSILDDEDVYKQFVLNNAIYKGMNAIYGGEYADIRTYEAKRRKKRYDKGRSLREKTTTNQG